MKILDIRGTNGSGKSSVVTLLAKGAGRAVSQTPCGMPYTILATEKHGLIAAVGYYNTPCGGADGVSSQQLITDGILELWQEQPQYSALIVEGSIVATVFTRWNELAKGIGDNYWFLFLDTPVDMCISRVLARRAAKGDTRTFDPDKTLKPRDNAIRRVAVKLKEDGRNVLWLDHRDPLEGLVSVL